MGKASKWLRNLLTGKKNENNSTSEVQSPLKSIPTNKEKKRWSFRWSVGAEKTTNLPSQSSLHRFAEPEIDKKRHASVSVLILTVDVKKVAVTKIQAVFRRFLARKALCALRGLVKLQALIRGELVRKQAASTLRRMQALVSLQARIHKQKQALNDDRSTQHLRYRQLSEMNKSERDTKTKRSHSVAKAETKEQRFSEYYGKYRANPESEYPLFSPIQSALTERSPRTQSGCFEDFTFTTTESTPLYLNTVSNHSIGCPFYPNYMANTESSRAKARSQSVPKQRTNAWERQTNRRRSFLEGRNTQRDVRMQGSPSPIGLSGNKYPCSTKLDKFSAPVKGSTSLMMTNGSYWKSIVGLDARTFK